MVWQNLRDLASKYGARIDLALFEEAFRKRSEGEKLGLTRGLEANFSDPKTTTEKKISGYIETYRTDQIQKLETDLFAQKKRLADAERKLKEKPTKGAEKEKAVAERQIARFKSRLERLNSTRASESDSRIYAFDFAPVIVSENGERTLVPMRYHLRPPGAPEDFDRKYPGCYNARRDSLTGFWKREFGKKHAFLVASSFFENVKLHDYEGRKLKKDEEPENIVIRFDAKGFETILIPCIWDEWTSGKETLKSFALITDEPPPEVSAAGHDRCPIFLKESNIDAWLNPAGKSTAELFTLLDDRERPKYVHRLAA